MEDVGHRFGPVHGAIAAGYEPLARTFQRQLEDGRQIGASIAVWRKGECVVDIWGGLADVEAKRTWERDTRLVVFSVTKGFAAMAFQLLADRGLLEWDAPVAQYWPGFGRNGKEGISVRTLLEHRGGLSHLDTKLTLADCCDPGRADAVREAMEAQRPEWAPGADQGYHAITFGLYARELFERIAGEDIGAFLRREIFEPTGSDAFLGTPASEDHRIATLYPPKAARRVLSMASRAITDPTSMEARVFRDFFVKDSVGRRAFMNPSTPKNDMRAYNALPVRRHPLAWASATASAQGIARAYLPFASGGSFGGRAFVKPSTLSHLYVRQGWSERDRVLQKPIGWSGGFVKEERHIFCPNPESFGHPGMGGALGWVDPVEELTFGYVMNRMDWRVRSLRALELTRSIYDSEAMLPNRML
jgi:CubicO group peptidase (beta-lactamase class C family)